MLCRNSSSLSVLRACRAEVRSSAPNRWGRGAADCDQTRLLSRPYTSVLNTTSSSSHIVMVLASRSAQGTRQLLRSASAAAPKSAVALPRCSSMTADPAPSKQVRAIHTSPANFIAYPGHIPVNSFQRSLLAVGSAVTSLLDPHRHDMVAVLGETTSDRQLPRLREALLNQCGDERLSILRERPRLSSESLNLAQLRAMPEGSLARAYVAWLEACKVTPDTREPVSPVGRECHPPNSCI